MRRLMRSYGWCVLTLLVMASAVIATGASTVIAAEQTAPSDSEPSFLDESEPAEPLAPPVPELGPALLKMVGAVVLLLGLLVGGLLAFQKFARRGVKFGRTERPLRIVDKLAIGPKKWVCLLNVCERYVVLGLAEKEINVLMEVTPPDEKGEDKDFSSTLERVGSSTAPGERQSG